MRVLQEFPDSLQHRFWILQYLVIPESQRPIAALCEAISACPTRLRSGCVLAAVQLDDQPPLDTAEVGDDWPNWNLPPKLRAPKLSRPQILP